MSHPLFRVRVALTSALAVCMLVMTTFLLPGSTAQALPVQPHFNYFLSTHYMDEDRYDDNGPQEQYDDRALPQQYITYDQVMRTYNASLAAGRRPFALNASSHSWQAIGPNTMTMTAPATYTGHAVTNSGRITALAVSNPCTPASCRVWLGAAGGGVWVTDDPLATPPHWRFAGNGIPSNAIGSITIDPNDRSGRTVYVGTGEPNGSSDSEAGVGLYRTTDGGRTWRLVPGSISAAKDRSIGSVAIDPTNRNHIFIGTDVARHGMSSVSGGRFSPPHAPVIGLYESWNGGRTFSLVFNKQSDPVDPSSPSGNDFFRGGVTKIEFVPPSMAGSQHYQIYFSMFDYGLFRSNNGSFEQVFASAGGGLYANSASSRTEFDLAPMSNGALRIYLGDVGSANADFYRVDNANVPAAQLTNGTSNPGWLKLSSATPGTPGFASYNFCEGQCWYDMWVASPPGHPDVVWIGGSMAYDEIFTSTPPSNGRAVQRSTDAGVHFTDMTNDEQNPPVGLHPDQHAYGFATSNPDIAFMGSDGGLMRTSGSFTDASSQCASRGISGADLVDCQMWLSAIPTRLYSMNAGLQTLQFQSVTLNPQNPRNDVIGGTQDNGTEAFTGDPNTWFESVGGDGGQSTINVANPNIRMHTYFGPNGDVNFRGDDPLGWDYIAGPLQASPENASFYVPLIADPAVPGTDFIGLEHVWRTQDNGGSQAFLDANCNEFGAVPNPDACGDWVPIGQNLVDSTFGTDKSGGYVVAIARAPSNHGTMWVATRLGRLFITTNADAPAASVNFTRIDTAAQPNRFISGIAVDPRNPYHAFVSFSGYSAYTPSTPGHVFDVTYNPATGKATWTDISGNLGDMPITGIAYDYLSGALYVSTDFGVLQLHHRGDWDPAAPGLPPVAVYGLTIDAQAHVLYAATHGRGIWRLNI